MKCSYCGLEIKSYEWVWVYDNGEAVIHQDCVDDWSFHKLENDLHDMLGKDAEERYGEN